MTRAPHVKLLYGADVVGPLRGSEHPQITYTEMSAIHEPRLRSYPLLVSPCRGEPGDSAYDVADNAYVGAATPES